MSLEPEPDLEAILAEINDRRARGEEPSLPEYVARYPSLRDALEAHFSTLASLDLFAGKDGSSKPGRRIGGYLLRKKIGGGGMGVVHLAEKVATGERVALKVLSPTLSESIRNLDRFHREAEISTRLRHPNIVLTLETGEADGQVFFAMEFVEGVNLAQVLA
ncbi:MAG TPA: protein kinase, partial [Planctomycetota bacterium]|nr:protein kinase [Planctomycetota bacterium]